MRPRLFFVPVFIACLVVRAGPPDKIPEPRIPFAPFKYICSRAVGPIRIDGRLDEKTWIDADWTEVFGDIEGSSKPRPRFRTRVQMLWDDSYLYVGAYLEEPHIWATLIEPDSILFQENDFEVFIDPDGDTHNYFEIEVNARNTVWDLFLVKPYRDGGPAVHSWDIRGLETAVHLMGTLNDPADKDKAWTVEMAIPFAVLAEGLPGNIERPRTGDQWRINFSRVEHWIEADNGIYRKIRDKDTGHFLPEDNWTWVPQGLVNIHYPEMWGYVQFSERATGGKRDKFVDRPEEKVKWALRKIYYRQWAFFRKYGRFAENLAGLGLENDRELRVKKWKAPDIIRTTESLFEAVFTGDSGGRWHIRQDGLVWSHEAARE